MEGWTGVPSPISHIFSPSSQPLISQLPPPCLPAPVLAIHPLHMCNIQCTTSSIVSCTIMACLPCDIPVRQHYKMVIIHTLFPKQWPSWYDLTSIFTINYLQYQDNNFSYFLERKLIGWKSGENIWGSDIKKKSPWEPFENFIYQDIVYWWFIYKISCVFNRFVDSTLCNFIQHLQLHRYLLQAWFDYNLAIRVPGMTLIVPHLIVAVWHSQ